MPAHDPVFQPEVLTVAEVALYLRVSETTIWRWCSRGKLPAFRIGRSWRVRRGDLEAMTSPPDLLPPPALPASTAARALDSISEDA